MSMCFTCKSSLHSCACAPGLQDVPTDEQPYGTPKTEGPPTVGRINFGPSHPECGEGLRRRQAAELAVYDSAGDVGVSSCDEEPSAAFSMLQELLSGRRLPNGFVPYTQPWIVCAAIKKKDSHFVITGARHFDYVMQQAIKGHKETEKLNRGWADADQGFIDQWCRFYTRKEAAQLAVQNGQCESTVNILFSEDLY